MKNVFTKARNKKKFTQQALANEMNVTRQTIANWESKRKTPSLKDLFKLSKILGVTVHKLVDYYNKEEVE